MAEEVLVTGIGLVTALGPDRERTWSALCQTRRGFQPLSLFELTGREPPVVAQVAHFPRKKGLPRRALPMLKAGIHLRRRWLEPAIRLCGAAG